MASLSTAQQKKTEDGNAVQVVQRNFERHLNKMNLYAYRDKCLKVIYYCFKIVVWLKQRGDKNADVKRLKKIINSMKIARLIFYFGRFTLNYDSFKDAYYESSLYVRSLCLLEGVCGVIENLCTDCDTFERMGLISSYPAYIDRIAALTWTAGGCATLSLNRIATSSVSPAKLWMHNISFWKAFCDWLQSLPETCELDDPHTGLVAFCGLFSGILSLYKTWVK